MTCGVPQGSTLGPLLFLIDINDIVNCSSILSFHLFADDTNIFYVNKDPKELEIVMNRELQKFYDYCALNKLSITVLAIFGGKRQLPPIMLPKIKLSAAIFCHRQIFVLLMMLHCLLNSINSSKYEHMIRK